MWGNIKGKQREKGTLYVMTHVDLVQSGDLLHSEGYKGTRKEANAIRCLRAARARVTALAISATGAIRSSASSLSGLAGATRAVSATIAVLAAGAVLTSKSRVSM